MAAFLVDSLDFVDLGEEAVVEHDVLLVWVGTAVALIQLDVEAVRLFHEDLYHNGLEFRILVAVPFRLADGEVQTLICTCEACKVNVLSDEAVEVSDLVCSELEALVEVEGALDSVCPRHLGLVQNASEGKSKGSKTVDLRSVPLRRSQIQRLGYESLH